MTWAFDISIIPVNVPRICRDARQLPRDKMGIQTHKYTRAALAIGIIPYLCGVSGVGSPAFAQNFNDRTICAAFTAKVYTRQPDLVLQGYLYIVNTMEKMDAGHTEKGEPGIMAALSDQGLKNLAAMATVHCENFPKMTVYNAVSFVYRGVRDMEIQFGVAK